MLFFQKNIKADLQRTESGKQIGPHKVCQAEPAVRLPCQKRSSLSKSGDMLSGEIVIRQKPSTVCISLQCLVVQHREQSVFIRLNPEGTGEFLKKIHPGIQIGGTVLAMYHSHQIAGGRGNQIQLFVNPGEFFFQNRCV